MTIFTIQLMIFWFLKGWKWCLDQSKLLIFVRYFDAFYLLVGLRLIQMGLPLVSLIWLKLIEFSILIEALSNVLLLSLLAFVILSRPTIGDVCNWVSSRLIPGILYGKNVILLVWFIGSIVLLWGALEVSYLMVILLIIFHIHFKVSHIYIEKETKWLTFFLRKAFKWLRMVGGLIF